MSTKEWFADIGAAAEELGYGIVQMSYKDIELVSRQDPECRVRIESHFLSGDFLRARLVRLEHRSSSAYSVDFARMAK